MFSDEASTVVEIEHGAARVTDKLKRFRNVIGGLHTFGVLRGQCERGTIQDIDPYRRTASSV
jgi:hypothetical protein